MQNAILMENANLSDCDIRPRPIKWSSQINHIVKWIFIMAERNAFIVAAVIKYFIFFLFSFCVSIVLIINMAIDSLPFTAFYYNYHYEHSYENESTMDDNAMTSFNTINKQKNRTLFV